MNQADAGAQPGLLVEARGIWKSYTTQPILKGVDLQVREKELVFIIGPSGSGKSTLLRCLNRLETPERGSIHVNGMDMMSPRTNLRQAIRQIGMVFQSFNLYQHMTAQDNVMLALRKVLGKTRAEAQAIARAALERVDLPERTHRQMPQQLSGGQQQRVAIARAIALEPRVMLFDEPTSALDPELVGSVLKVMHELRDSGMTMVVVSHEMAFAKSAADRVVFMADGEVLEEGPPADIFDAPQHERTRQFIRQINRV